MPWHLYLALKQLFPTGRVVSFFTLMSCLGVAVGVALLVVSSSVMGGFGYQIRKMIVDTQGEVQVVGFGGGNIDDAAALIPRLLEVPGVAAATPTAEGAVMLQYRGRPAYPQFLGLDLRTSDRVFELRRYMIGGSIDELDDDSIILGVRLAQSLGVRIGDQVELASPAILEKLARDQVMLPRVVRIAGVFEIGHDHLDRNLAVGTLRLMQDVYDLGSGVQKINVRLKPGVDEFEAAAALNAILPRNRRAMTWFESNADFQSIIRFEKYMVFFLLTFIVVVAALSIMSSLLISVVRKTREIGLLGALGGKPRHVALCFCAQGLVLGIFGTGLGLVIGWLVLAFRNQIVAVLARATVGEDVFIQFYQFVKIPSHTTAFDLVIIVAGSVVISTLAGLLPAWRAARLKPVEALRSE